ncbi:MAG: hypothetical protein WD572_01780, partial [Gammaproteobacteria bacterium]
MMPYLATINWLVFPSMFTAPSSFTIRHPVTTSTRISKGCRVMQPVDHANTLFAESYAIVRLKAGYRRASGISVFIEGRNLADKKYAATTGVITNA